MTKSRAEARQPPATPPPGEGDERALVAAGRLFREKGFAATTVREIAAAAEMLPGSLHYRYPSKEALLVALMRRGVERVMAAARVAIAATPEPVERVHLALRAHLELLCGGDDSLFVLLFDWRSLPPGAKEGVERERARYEQFWDGLLLDAYASGRARPVLDVELVRHFGFGALNWVATWYRPGAGRTPAQIADAMWSILAYGLLSEGVRPPNLDEHFAALFAPPSPPES